MKKCEHCHLQKRAVPEEYVSDMEAGDKPSKIAEMDHSNDESSEDSRQIVTRGNSLTADKKSKRKRKRKHRKQFHSKDRSPAEAVAAQRQSTRNPENLMHIYG